jgi:chloramphenicol-sensitive protein RarD
VSIGMIVETSLGYFINPLVSVLLGVIFLRERLRPMQWVPVGLATLGVIYLTIDYGRLPWIALLLAASFGLYGLAKKTAPLGSFYSLTMETGVLFIPSLIFLLGAAFAGTGAFGQAGLTTTLLLLFTGPITIAPLLLFGSAARQMDLSMMGLLQYITPTMQFLIGVLVYREPFTTSSLIGFAIIWTALILFWVEGFYQRQSLNRRLAKPLA